MKSSKKIFGAVSAITAMLAIATPFITSCSNAYADLNIVSKGNGEYFVSSENGFGISFNDGLISSLNSNKSSYNQFKKAIVDRLLYNWYKDIAEEGNVQTFKDNWSTWNDDAKDSYDDQVQNYKDSHGSTWKYYFQNEVLDPVGGTKDAYIFNQVVSSIRSALPDLVFNTNYLAYSQSPNSSTPVNSVVNNFTPTIFNDSSSWKNVDFYAYANTNYNPSSVSTLDDVYAQMQKETFDKWTKTEHPISVSMCLWKYAEPTEGMRSIYSDLVPNNASSSSGGDDEGGDDTSNTLTTTLKDDESSDYDILSATYAVPAFPEYRGSTLNANGKFYSLMSNMINSYALLDKNGICNVNNSTQYTDDSSTTIIVTTSNMYSSLDETFAGAVASLYASIYSTTNSNANIDIKDKFLPYSIKNTIPSVASQTDILSNFMFTSNDQRIWNSEDGNLTATGNSLKSLGNYVLDLSKTFQSSTTSIPAELENSGSSKNFNSLLFNPSHTTSLFDYYGSTDGAGVQFVVSALRLTTDETNSTKLPYVLVRDSFGVHLIGLNGATAYNGGSYQNGYLTAAASENNGNTMPMSQGRMNNMLKAQSLNQSTNNTGDTSLEINSTLKTYFTDNLDDIIIQMAKNKDKRAAGNNAGNVIFDDNNIFGGIEAYNIYELIQAGDNYYLLQSTVTAWSDASKKLFTDRVSNVSASTLSRSEQFLSSTDDNYANCLTTAFPFNYVEASTPAISSNLFLGHSSYDVLLLGNWITDYTVTSNQDIFTSSKYSSYENLAANGADAINNLKTEFTNSITNIIKKANIKPNTSTSGTMKYSEHLNTTWNDDGTNVVTNGFYLSLYTLLNANTFEASAKLQVMKQYWDNRNFSKDNKLLSYATCQFFASKIFTDSTPVSYYLSSDTDNINENTYAYIYLQEMLQLFGSQKDSFTPYGDNYYNLLIYLDTLAYLLNDNCANLLTYLSSYLPYGTEGDLVWINEDNYHANPSFLSSTHDDQIGLYFNYQANYNGYYDNTYLPTSASSSTPTSYTSNSAYFNYAPLPYYSSNSMVVENDFAMGFAGLVTSASTTSAITSNISDRLFTNTYNTKLNADGDHIGGWNKYGSYDQLIEYIKDLNSITDLQKIATNLGNANQDANFTNGVVNWINRTTYVEGDPEVEAGLAKIGEPITPTVMRQRLIGENTSEVLYKDKGIGLASYKEKYGDAVNNLFARFGNAANGGKGAELLYNGNTYNNTHIIDVDDTNPTGARVAVIQLNNNDVQSFQTLKDALNVLGANIALGLIYSIASQIALNSTIQTQALNDVITTELGSNKFTVYDRNFNDDLAQLWVKDWKSTN